MKDRNNFITITRENSNVQELKTLELKKNHRNGNFEVELNNGTKLYITVEFRTSKPYELYKYAPGFLITITSNSSGYQNGNDYVEIDSYEMATKSGQQLYYYKTFEDEVHFLIKWEGNIAKGTVIDQLRDLWNISEDRIRTPNEHKAFIKAEGWDYDENKQDEENNDFNKKSNSGNEWKNGLKEEVKRRPSEDSKGDNGEVIDFVAWKNNNGR